MKTNKQTNVFALITMLLATFFYSCNKQKDIQPQSEKYLSFASVEEYNATLTKVLAMTEEERLAWEKQQGFTSFATKSNEVYSQVAEKELSVDELKQEVVGKENFINLVEQNNEFILDNTLSLNNERYLINCNNIVQIGDTIFKIFKNDFIKTHINNINDILLFEENSIIEDFPHLIKYSNRSIFKDATNFCTDSPSGNYSYLDERATSNRDRTLVQVRFAYTSNYQAVVSYEARAYFRTAGIWYHAKRTISCSFKVAIDYQKYDNTWFREIKTYSCDGFNTYALEGNLYILTLSGYTPILHFGGADCWAKTPDTDRAVIECNTHLF